MSKVQTLADFAIPIPLGGIAFRLVLRCTNCGRELPQRTLVESYEDYVVAQCPYCKWSMPFRREDAA